MSETKCYAMVRGSAIRVTGLGRRGSLTSPLSFATSKSVSRVQINETTEAASNELLNGETDNDTRLHFARPSQTLFYTVDVDFLRVDPGVLSLVAGVGSVHDVFGGFGEMPFGVGEFGEGIIADDGPEVGFDFFDVETRRPAASFALEVWSRLDAVACAGGERQYGYTVFPFLKGGYLSGFEFANGLVSFNLRRAQTRKVPRWGVGPYDLEGPHERLLEPVSRNTMFRTTLTTALPPVEVCGLQEAFDDIEGGTATMTTSDVVDGEFVDTSVWVVEGGAAL